MVNNGREQSQGGRLTCWSAFWYDQVRDSGVAVDSRLEAEGWILGAETRIPAWEDLILEAVRDLEQ